MWAKREEKKNIKYKKKKIFFAPEQNESKRSFSRFIPKIMFGIIILHYSLLLFASRFFYRFEVFFSSLSLLTSFGEKYRDNNLRRCSIFSRLFGREAIRRRRRFLTVWNRDRRRSNSNYLHYTKTHLASAPAESSCRITPAEPQTLAEEWTDKKKSAE